MAVTYGFYNALNHDRLYDAIQMSSIFDGIIRDGIFSTIGDTMIVTAPEDGLYVNVGSGRAWFNHTWTLNDTDYPIEAEQAEVVLDRIDAVILEVNSSAEVRANSIKFLKGTPSSNPVKPTLTHNAEVNQYALAYVRIRAGQTTIFQSDIENAVGTDETPFTTGVLQQVSIETLLKQWEAEFNTYFTNFKNTSTTEFNNWFATKVSEYTAWFAQMQTNMDSNFNEFDAWFQNIKDQLDENQAGHLQLQIDALNSDINALEAEMPFAGGSKVNINFEYDVVPNIQYSNGHYKLTVGDTVRENNFSASELHFNEYGILTVGDGILEVTYDVTDSRTGKVTHASYTYTINMPYFGRFAYNVTISADLYSYQGWLESIGKDASSYPTIEDVFADEKLLRELMTRHVSVDYLVEWLANNNEDAHTVLNNDYCAKWINLRDYALDMLYANPTVKAVMDEVDKYGYGEWALIDGTWQPKGAVPIMTSNTEPYGETIYDSVYLTNYPYNVFDNNDSTVWSQSTGSVPSYIGYKFMNPIMCKRLKITIIGDSTYGLTAKDYNIQASNDGNTWIDLTTGTLENSLEDITKEINFENEGYYLYYRFYVTSKYFTESGFVVRTLQFYGRELKVSVPKMTSNTAPWGEVFADEYNDSATVPYKAFDNDDSSWWTSTIRKQNSYVGYDFKKPVLIKKVCLKQNQNAGNTVRVEYSDDKNVWTSADCIFNTIAETIVFSDVNEKKSHRYWRFLFAVNNNYTSTIMANFYGLDYSEREFEEGSTMKYLYDHGVELEPLESYGSGTIEKGENSFIVRNKKFGGCKADFTNHSLSRMKVGNNYLYDQYSAMLIGESISDPTGNLGLARFDVSNLPNNMSIPISSVNQVAYLTVYANTNVYIECTELWLE